MDTDGDSQFDIEEWTRAVANVYHDELLNADGSAHELAAGAKKMHKAAPVAKSAAKPASSGAFEAAARPTVTVYDAGDAMDINGDNESVSLPTVFTAPIRMDIVRQVSTSMAKNSRQAYSVNKFAGHQTAAESWGTGRAVSRIPRVPGGGTHRSGQGAFGNMCRGGRMFAPTKTWRKWHKRINTNQKRFAITSALAASAIPALVMARGHKVDDIPELPFVVTDNMQQIQKTQKALEFLSKFGIAADVARCKQSRKIRRGKGKMRNRRYVMRRGPLVVYDSADGCEKAFRNLPGVELCHVDRLNLLQLAPGGHMGRLIVWTQTSFEKLDALYGTYQQKATLKNGYSLPRHIMTQGDLARVINSDEIQSAIKAAQPVKARAFKLKKNPLKNLGAMVKLNPYSMTLRRVELKKAAAQARRNAEVAAMRAAGKSPSTDADRKKRKEKKARKQASKDYFATMNTQPTKAMAPKGMPGLRLQSGF